jgi:hypothetical protein
MSHRSALGRAWITMNITSSLARAGPTRNDSAMRRPRPGTDAVEDR